MALHFNDILLGLFVINIGIAFGAGLYETRITLPLWFENTKTGMIVNRDFIIKMDVGRKFWGLITTLPLTLLTLVSLVLAFQTKGQVKDWWMAAGIIMLIERIGTFSYFIPTIIKITKEDSKAEAKAKQWIRMNRLRMALNFAGWFCALVAFYYSRP